jgi:hypothetical protein
MADINIDLFVNIIKRPELILYKSNVGPMSANVAYAGSRELSSDTNITIIDLSGSKSSNRSFSTQAVNFSNESSIPSPSSNFLLTSKYNIPQGSSGSLVKTPLFFKHSLNHFQANDKIEGIRFYDDLLNELNISDMKIDDTLGAVYSNLESFYSVVPDSPDDPNSIEYSFYYIQYRLIRGAVEEIHVELLDNKEVFQEATEDDYDPDTLLLNANANAYSIEEDGANFQINLPAAIDVSLRQKENKRLKVVYPTSKDYSDPWHVRVINGKVFDTHLYKIAAEQFNSQNFNPIIGVKKVQKETPTIINKKIIKTDYEALLQDLSLETFVEVRIKNKEGEVKGYFSTNEYASGYTKWSLANRKGIKSIDHDTGFIEIEGVELSSTDDIECDYYYSENYYEFTDINFNPIQNEHILERKTILYIDPNASEDKTLLSKQFKLDGTALDSGHNYPTWKAGNLTYFILAEIIIGEFSSIKDIASLDTRIIGGGIKESRALEVEADYPEYDFIWNEAMWDGKPYPGNLCYHLQIPIDKVLKEGDGIHLPRELKTIASRHTALGVYSAIKAYGAETEITTFNVSKNSGDPTKADVKVNWLGVDTFRFKVIYKKSGDSTWIEAPTLSAVGVSNAVYNYSDTITLLDMDSLYNFAVVGYTEINSSWEETVTQHINEDQLSLLTSSASPDAMNIVELVIPILG